MIIKFSTKLPLDSNLLSKLCDMAMSLNLWILQRSKDSSIAFSDMLIHTYAITQMLASTTPMISWMLISKSSMAVSSMSRKFLLK